MLKIFRKNRTKNLNLKYFEEKFMIVLGIVLVWRGIWYLLDEIDKLFFGSNHFWTAFVGIILGIIILYWPDGDLKEFDKI